MAAYFKTYSYPVMILSDLKHAFWPFQHDHTKTLFLRAATAANCVDRSDFVGESLLTAVAHKLHQLRLLNIG
uniref:Uncharacterized protein n=1 Tax=Glycine max TaxID=3847 RepID=C6TDK9_SOYBN|nr:unknown [Glycine max]